MATATQVESLVQMMAYKPLLATLKPVNGSGMDEPPMKVRATALLGFLSLWSEQVDLIVPSLDSGETFSGNEINHSGNGEPEPLRLLLESLANAVEILLAFRKADHPIDVPEGVLRSTNRLFAKAEEGGICTKDSNVQQVARRLAAAISHQSKGPRPVTVDDQGRLYDLSGTRLFEFDPEKILRGRQEVREGKTHSLEEIREAEGRNGS